jgi:hypothetical protein
VRHPTLMSGAALIDFCDGRSVIFDCATQFTPVHGTLYQLSCNQMWHQIIEAVYFWSFRAFLRSRTSEHVTKAIDSVFSSSYACSACFVVVFIVSVDQFVDVYSFCAAQTCPFLFHDNALYGRNIVPDRNFRRFLWKDRQLW